MQPCDRQRPRHARKTDDQWHPLSSQLQDCDRQNPTILLW